MCHKKLHLSSDIVVSVRRAYTKRILSPAHVSLPLNASPEFSTKKNKKKKLGYFFVNTRVGAAMTNNEKKKDLINISLSL